VLIAFFYKQLEKIFCRKYCLLNVVAKKKFNIGKYLVVAAARSMNFFPVSPSFSVSENSICE